MAPDANVDRAPRRRATGSGVDRAALRSAFRRHAEGVTIITTRDQFGNQWGLTATAVTSVSLDPPLLLVCVDNRSGLIGPLTDGTSFIVHLLAGDQAQLAMTFATPLEDKFDGASYQFTRSGCARLNGVLAALECVPHGVHPGGDHTIVVGRVVDICTDDATPAALVFFDGKMSAIASSD